MIDSETARSTAALRARRAIGAMFFSVFGGAWMVLWWYRALRASVPVLVLVSAGTILLLGFAYTCYRRGRAALEAEPETPERRRAGRWFHIINAGQWILILVVANVLANIGLPAWVLPAAMFIIGLHFLPLARVFRNRANYVTGCALMALAVAWPLAAPGGPQNPAGCLGAGIILWASAAWAIRPGKE